MAEISREEARRLLAEMDARNAEPSREEARRLLGMDEGWKIDPNNPAHANPEGGKAFRANVLQGLGKIASDFSKAISFDDKNIPQQLSSVMPRKSSIPENFAPAMSPEEQKASEDHPNYAMLGYGTGYIAPSLTPIGLEGQLVRTAANLPRAARIGAKVAGRSGEGAIVGGVYNPENQGQGAALGAGLGAASIPVEAATPYAFNAIRSLSQIASKYGATGLKRLLGAHATADEMQRAMQANKNIGTHSSFGEVAEAPTIRSLESISAYVPLSGNANAYHKKGKKIKETVENSINSMKPPAQIKVGEEMKPYDVNDSLQEALQTASKNAENKKRELYKKVNDVARKEDVKVDIKEYTKAAKDAKKQIGQFSKENREFEDIYDPSLKERLETILNNKPEKSIILDQSGRNFETKSEKNKSFGAAFDTDKRINALMKVADRKGDVATSSILNKLKIAINNDIDRSAMDSGKKELVNDWVDAKEHFKNEVVPLRDKKLSNFIKGNINNEKIIPTFLKGGQFEQPQLLSQLTRYLTPTQKKYVAHEYLTKGLREVYGQDEVVEGNVLRAYKAMGDKTKKELFTNAERKKLDSALITKEKTNLDLNQMIQTKTGEKNAKILGALAIGGIGTAYGTNHENYANTGLAAYFSALGLGLASRNKGLQKQFLKALRASERDISNPLVTNGLKVDLSRAVRPSIPLIAHESHIDNDQKKRGGK